jgi:hypothetical protein
MCIYICFFLFPLSYYNYSFIYLYKGYASYIHISRGYVKHKRLRTTVLKQWLKELFKSKVIPLHAIVNIIKTNQVPTGTIHLGSSWLECQHLTPVLQGLGLSCGYVNLTDNITRFRPTRRLLSPGMCCVVH